MFNLFFPYFSTRQETIYTKPTQNQHSAQNPLTLISCLFRNVNAAGHTVASLSLWQARLNDASSENSRGTCVNWATGSWTHFTNPLPGNVTQSRLPQNAWRRRNQHNESMNSNGTSEFFLDRLTRVSKRLRGYFIRPARYARCNLLFATGKGKAKRNRLEPTARLESGRAKGVWKYEKEGVG